jgi:hypothetical protein
VQVLQLHKLSASTLRNSENKGARHIFRLATAGIAHYEFEDEKFRPRQIDFPISAARGTGYRVQG